MSSYLLTEPLPLAGPPSEIIRNTIQMKKSYNDPHKYCALSVALHEKAVVQRSIK